MIPSQIRRSPITGTDFIAAQLARISIAEGYQEGLNGMKAVAFVFRNRVRAGWFGGSWLEVLSHRQEYSANLQPLPEALPDIRIYSINNFLQEVSGIVGGTIEDDVTVKRGSLATFRPGTLPVALYYGRTDQITNEWFLTEIARNPEHKRLANMATLTFWS